MKCLMCVDVQKGFITKQQYQDIINPINSIMNEYDLIVVTKFINLKNSFYETKLNWCNLQDAESQQIVLNITENAIILEKTGYGLSQKDIELLKEKHITEIDICGLQTDACVYAIAFQLFDNGIYPNVLINYTATSNDENQNQAKDLLIHQFGKVDEKK